MATAIYGDGFDVGDFLYASWGYDQTNIDFFLVTKRTPKTVDLVEVAATTVGEGPGPVVPGDDFVYDHDHEAHDDLPPGYGWWEHARERDPACWKPRQFRRHKVNPPSGRSSGSVKIDKVRRAWPWEGDPLRDTIAAGEPGH